MLRPWLDLPDARARLASWSELTGLDLLTLGTEASDEDVRPTEVAQPLLTAAALLSGRAVLAGGAPELVCGHSIGELSALSLAGVMSDDDAVALAAGRGALMAQAAAVRPTTMAAVLGGTVDEHDLATAGLEVATINVPGQVVVGGPVDALTGWARAGDLLVVGAHGRGPLRAADRDAVLRRVLDAAPCDVLVVPSAVPSALV